MKSQQPRSAFQVGDWVRVPYYAGKVKAKVVEDVGIVERPQRRHLYRVEIPGDPDDPLPRTLPEEELEYLGPTPSAFEPPMDKVTVTRYLKQGGLQAILWFNMEEALRHPRAWMAWNIYGKPTFTIRQGNGLVGGLAVPNVALYGQSIYAPKRDEVIAFVESFGLSHDEAVAVVEAVGVAPKPRPARQKRSRFKGGSKG